MKHLTRLIEINAPIVTVFDCLSDNEKQKKWIRGLKRTEYPEGRDEDNPTGAKFYQYAKDIGKPHKYEGEILEFDRPLRLKVKITDKAATATVDYRLEKIDDKRTVLFYEGKIVEASTLARIIILLTSWTTRRILKRQLASLKKLAERLTKLKEQL